ncbi:heme-dependent catalase [Penicillium argentinense]|uniref:Heme-dependent catalase n=1 Tax=Penicillium argentinense TaxID=1131581 RepID=A0A9W9G5Q4_9EURO|nr:heme-dependent catalase [Penicillium argentinense]KAJ5112160.1 heme-dependent catalase [Penicillium argentinense]
MPLPSNPETVESARQLVDVFHKFFGSHPSFRPAHAKGILLKGTFEPTPNASTLSTAPHLQRPSTPIIARFSSSTGIPDIRDTNPNGNPHGFAVRFMLEETPRRVHTDIITHSTPFFPAKDGPDALAFFTALANGTIVQHLETHPAAKAFIQAPKPFPVSFATEEYFGIHAFKLVNGDGMGTFIRYRILPRAGKAHLREERIEEQSGNYLFDQLEATLKDGAVEFDLVAQVAEEGDVTDDCTVHWPEDREIVTLGNISLEQILEDNADEQKRIIYDPVPRVDGIEPSDDPLVDVRAALYLISGQERRAA